MNSFRYAKKNIHGKGKVINFRVAHGIKEIGKKSINPLDIVNLLSSLGIQVSQTTHHH